MLHTFFIAPTSIQTGLTSISLGLIRALDERGLRVAFCKPVAVLPANPAEERSTQMVRMGTRLTPPQPLDLKYAQQMISDRQLDRLMEEVIRLHRLAAKDADVIIIEGIEPDRSEPFTAKLNVEMAKTLDAEVILVSAPEQRSAAELAEHVDMSSRMFGVRNNPKLLGVVINKVNAPKDPNRPIRATEQGTIDSPAELTTQLTAAQYKQIESPTFKVLGLIPWDANLVAPRTEDVARFLNAEILNHGNIQNARVNRISLCARTVPNMVGALQPGTLIVTPGDREDILLASAMAANNKVPLAGLLLTSGYKPDERVFKLVLPALENLPVLSVNTDTYQTASHLSHMNTAVNVEDTERMNRIMGHVAANLDAEWLVGRCKIDSETRLSPAAFRYQLVQLAQDAKKRVVLPEGDEPRTIQAAAICQERGIADCILIGKREQIEIVAESQGIKLPAGLTILDPDEVRPQYVAPMVELRKHKNLTPPAAEAQLEDNVVLATMMLALNEVDGLVSGAVHTTANTIRPALQLIKTAPGAKLVSSVFFMLLPDQVLVYGDCAVNPDPSAEELADIALQSAASAQAFGLKPKVAMISYSTGTSGEGSDVEKVRSATQMARELAPELLIDGPLQYDAATTASVAKSKAPNSPVAGQANVLVFPDLNTGNTTYKAVQRSAGVVSIGPMLQGLAKPVNDLSRGALVEDIVYTIALTAIQATKP